MLKRAPRTYAASDASRTREQGVAAETKEKRLQLLRDCSGSFRPGVLTALVGVSGAGKTTLMDVLAGRKTGACCQAFIKRGACSFKLGAKKPPGATSLFPPASLLKAGACLGSAQVARHGDGIQEYKQPSC